MSLVSCPAAIPIPPFYLEEEPVLMLGCPHVKKINLTWFHSIAIISLAIPVIGLWKST